MLSARLPTRIEASAVKRIIYSTEIVTSDGGRENRNARWSDPAEEWDCSIPPVLRTSLDFLDSLAVFHAAIGSYDTFLFHDPVDCVDYEVRFKDDLFTVQGVGNKLTASFTLKREPGADSP